MVFNKIFCIKKHAKIKKKYHDVTLNIQRSNLPQCDNIYYRCRKVKRLQRGEKKIKEWVEIDHNHD